MVNTSTGKRQSWMPQTKKTEEKSNQVSLFFNNEKEEKGGIAGKHNDFEQTSKLDAQQKIAEESNLTPDSKELFLHEKIDTTKRSGKRGDALI